MSEDKCNPKNHLMQNFKKYRKRGMSKDGTNRK